MAIGRVTLLAFSALVIAAPSFATPAVPKAAFEKAPEAAQDTPAQVASLAGSIRAAVALADSDATGSSTKEEAQVAVLAAVQDVVAAAGYSPAVTESAIVAVRDCAAGAVVTSGPISISCASDSRMALSANASSALNSVESIVLAALNPGPGPASKVFGTIPVKVAPTPPPKNQQIVLSFLLALLAFLNGSDYRH